MSLRMDMIYAIRDTIQAWDALSSKCVFIEDRRGGGVWTLIVGHWAFNVCDEIAEEKQIFEGNAPKRSRTEDFESIYCVSNKQTYKRVRLDSNDKDSKSAQVDCPSGDAEACDDKVTPTKFISHISPEHSGPSFKKWRTSQAGATSQKSDVTEPVSATVCRKKIDDNRVERVVDILSKLVERLEI